MGTMGVVLSGPGRLEDWLMRGTLGHAEEHPQAWIVGSLTKDSR